MPLQRQIIDIPLGAGLAEKIDPKLLQPGQGDATLENARFEDDGRVSKRYGYAHVAGPSGLPHSLFEHEGSPLQLHRDGTLYRYHAKRSTAWDANPPFGEVSEKHPVIPMEVSKHPIASDHDGVTGTDVAINANGLFCYVWVRSSCGCVFWQIRDTDHVLVDQGSLSMAGTTEWNECWVVAVQGSFVVVAQGIAGSTDIVGWYVDANSTLGAWSAGSQLITGMNGLDVCKDDTANRMHIVCHDGTTLFLKRYTAALSNDLSGSTAWAMGAFPPRCDHHEDDDRIWVVGSSGGSGVALQYAVFTNAYALYQAVGTALTLTGVGYQYSIVTAGPNEAWLAVDDGGVHLRLVRAADGGGDGASSETCSSPQFSLVAQLFYDSTIDRVFVPARHNENDTLQPFGVLLTPYNQDIGGLDAPRLGAVARFLVDHIPVIAAPGNTIGHSVYASVGSANEYSNWLFSAIAIGASADAPGVEAIHIIQSLRPVKTLYRDGVTYVSTGGMLWAYDGEEFAEATPHMYPETLVVALAGGGALGNGVYSWVVVWEWEDNRGNIHRSAPSLAATDTATTNQKATLTFYDMPFSAVDAISSADLIRAAVYRTEAGGSVYYYVGHANSFSGSPTTGMVSFEDLVSDANLGAVIYTSGGVLAANPAPPALDILMHKERIWVIDAERRDEIAFSKLLQETVAPEFNASLRVRLPEGEGTALARLDDKVIFFTKDQIFFLYGDGPNNLGEQDSFSQPQLISSDVGCEDRNSVVEGSFGVMFRSARGLELLGRDLAVAPFAAFGGKVDDSVSSTRICMSAVRVPDRNEVRFHLRASDPLVYNYLFDRWAVWTTHTNMLDAAVVDGVYNWIDTSRALYVESEAYSDNIAGSASHIVLKVVTPWIKLAGLQGFKRVRRAMLLGVALDEARCGVAVTINYDDTLVQTETFDTLDAEDPFQRMIYLAIQKVESIKFSLVDGPVGEGNAEGMQFVKLSLEVAAKRGVFKLPNASRT